jgi:tetratricopeptide (TPR) repeat protein
MTQTRIEPAPGAPLPTSEPDRLSPHPAAILVCVVLAATWSWWALKDGAYFGVVLLPGGVLFCLVLALLLRSAPWSVALRPPAPAALALLALIGLGAWAALSALWSPSPAAAIADGQRILIYAVVFALGVGLAITAGARANLAMVPLAVAGAVAGSVCAIGLLSGDDPQQYLEVDNTLDFPIGYRNANAAFFLIACFPALGLAADRSLPWPLRGIALGAATLCIDLALLSQSRGSVAASIAACGIYVLAAPLRLRALVWLLLAALCAAGVVPALSDLYQLDGPPRAAVDEMHAAGRAVVATSALAVGLGALAAWIDRRRSARVNAARTNRAVAAGIVIFVAASAAAFVITVGDPIDWVNQKAQEFRAGSEPSAERQSSRFALNFGTGRDQLWEVAFDQFSDNPVLGDGAGGFQYAYLRERPPRGVPVANDAHSVEFEVLGELGLVGLALLAIALAAAVVGTLRARRLGPARATLTAVALASGTYWLAHASIDWFFHYPALTAPALGLLGSACAVGARVEASGPDRRRFAIVALIGVFAISLIPPFLSERYVNDAYAGWREDLDRAYDDLDRAASLNRFSNAPLLAEGAIAQASGDRERALAAFGEAAERVPEEWASHYLLADLYATDEPELARHELEIARELYPHSYEVRELERKLENRDAEG